MQDMFPDDHGNYIGWIERMLLVDRIDLRAKHGIAIGTIVEIGDVDTRKIVRFGKLPSELRRVSLVERIGHKKVELVRIAHPHLVGHVRADAPHIRYLTVDPAAITALAIDRSQARPKGLPSIFSFRV